MKKLIL